MPQQQYIKYLYEQEELSIKEISDRVCVDWRTADKYAKKDDWSPVEPSRKRRKPILEPYVETIDVWLLEDRLLPRKDRRTAKAIWKQLSDKHGFEGSERTVRSYVAYRKRELKLEEQEKYLELEHLQAEAQVDFGTVHTIWDGMFKEFKSLTIAFPYSNPGFGVPVPGENQLCFLYALRHVFEAIGGVPQKMRFDNLTAAVISIGKNGHRNLTELFKRFMLHYRFEAEFCGVNKGNEKGAVENKVGYSRRNWYVPYLPTAGFSELTTAIHEQAMADLNRPHYKKGTLQSILWDEEQKALLPLPSTPFEPVEFKTIKVNKYGRVIIDQESYDLPAAPVGAKTLAKLWWDKVELLDENQHFLTTFPRAYTLKAKPIDWKGHFAIFVRKPKGAKHSILYSFLPQALKSYLEEDDGKFKERLSFINTLLQEGYEIAFLEEAFTRAGALCLKDQALIWHLLYQLENPSTALSELHDDYSPQSVKDYRPQVEEYDQLVDGIRGGADHEYAGTEL